MLPNDLQGIADAVLRRARSQGFVLARDFRQELVQAGHPEDEWKQVLALIAPSLRFRHGRYYYVPPVSDRMRNEQQHLEQVHEEMRQLIEQHQAASRQVDRREQDRIDFIYPVKIQTDDNRELTVLSRDISSTGIRLIGTRGLLGQKIRVALPSPGEGKTHHFRVRILWTCVIGDGLYENGGSFIETVNE
jgi:PilZ domain